MRLTTCDVCGDKINEHFKGARLGKEPTIIEVPDYIIEDKAEGDSNHLTPYDACWDCQDKIYRAVFKCIQETKTKEKEEEYVPPYLRRTIHEKINYKAQ